MKGIQRAEAREAIATAAERLFREKGYEATTMDEIAAAAGVSKGTLYRYVAGKEALRVLLAPRLPAADLRDRDARARILEVAMELIARQGFARTSLDEIAAAAGVSRSGIYWHFKSKSDVMAAIIAEYSPIPHIAAVLHEAGDAPFEEVMRRVYAAFFDFAEQRIAFLRAVIVEAQGNPDLGAIFQRHVATPLFGPLGAYLQRVAPREGLRPMHPILVIQALMGPLFMHLITRDLLQERLGLHFDREEITRSFLTVFFQGIRTGMIND